MRDAVCGREAGIILPVDATRLSGNGREWHAPLGFRGVAGCLLADGRTVHDPRLPADRMVLGMHGTMSEPGRANMRRRSVGGRDRKAARGALFLAVSAGYRRVGRNATGKQPDLRVRGAVGPVFRRVGEMQGVRQVHPWFHDGGSGLPSRPTGGSEPRWQLPNHARVHGILTNPIHADPIHAGAYAYGRTGSRVELRGGEKGTARRVASDRDGWQVFIPDSHEGHISLETYGRNRRVIAENSTKMMPSGRRGAVRGGAALLAGLPRCGHCGRRLTVNCSGTRGAVPRYIRDPGVIDHNGPECIPFGGAPADDAAGGEILRVLGPAWRRRPASPKTMPGRGRRRFASTRLRLGVRAAGPVARGGSTMPSIRRTERRWNGRLVAVQGVGTALEHARGACADMGMDEGEREACLRPGIGPERAWNHGGVTAETRRRILRAAVGEAVVRCQDRRVRLPPHGRGGDHTELFVARIEPRAGIVT